MHGCELWHNERAWSVVGAVTFYGGCSDRVVWAVEGTENMLGAFFNKGTLGVRVVRGGSSSSRIRMS